MGIDSLVSGSSGGSSGRSRCHVHTYEDDIVVDMKYKLEQEGEERGFLLCDVPATYTVYVRVRGRLAQHLCFYECVQLHIECMGPNDPKALKPIVKKYNCKKVGKWLKFEFDIPANHFCDEVGEAECGLVCCLAATMTSRTLCGTPGHIMCVLKGPCLGVHKSPA